ncbi:MAG: hydroxylacyl-CoA dehydrogenase [Caulobacteraceae bacterium]|nr:hydroxylacyl-CoA dehydrogenase [Caulobacteraceae bacterium]
MPALTSDRSYAGKTVAIIGGGVIGASWAALFLVNGLKVIVSDPDPEIESKVQALMAAALPALQALGYEAVDVAANLSFEKDNARAVAHADIVQECGPEKPEFKQALWKIIEAAAPKGALLCSSSSTIPASVQFTQMADQSRLLVGHPFNPPHLMPLVEVVPTPKTDPAITARALAFYRGVGKVALEIKKEVPGFVANRLQAAIFQESVFLVAEGVVSLDQLDDVVTNSLGIRWATSGPFLSFHLGGGPGGLPHFLEHLGPPMEAAWKYLGKASLDDATKARLIDQLGASYGASSFYALSETRDEKEVAVINGLAHVQHAS